MSASHALTLSFLSLSAVSMAAEFYHTPTYSDIRWLGRGNTGVALISDGTAAFYNPAGLGKSGVYNISVLNPSLGGNRDSYDAAKVFLDSSPESISDYLEPFMGRAISAQATYFPYVRVPNFMFGYFIANSETFFLRNPVTPELNIDYRYDRGLIMGGAYEVIPGLSVGASLRFQRRSMIKDILGGAIITDLSLDALLDKVKVGEGFGLNLGAQYRREISASQSLHFGMAMQDATTTRFYSKSLGTGEPLTQARYLSLGVAYTAQLPGVSFALLLDGNDLTRPQISYSKRMQIGAEVALPMVTVRGGMYQGYWSAGMSVAMLPFLTLDLASYAEELGVSGGQRSSRFYMMGLQMGMELLEQKKGRKQKYTLDHL